VLVPSEVLCAAVAIRVTRVGTKRDVFEPSEALRTAVATRVTRVGTKRDVLEENSSAVIAGVRDVLGPSEVLCAAFVALLLSRGVKALTWYET
jgi:hypothetical protein